MNQELIYEAVEESQRLYLMGKEKDFEGAYIFLASILARPGKITKEDIKWAEEIIKARVA